MGMYRFWIEGIPIKSKFKVFAVIFLLGLLLLNITLPLYFEVLQYPRSGWVSVGIIFLGIIFSIGSWTAESIVLALLVFSLASVWWELGILENTPLRRSVLLGTIGALILTSSLGKVSLPEFFSTLKRQFGVKR